mgnify:CR=1 FL=1
MPLASFQVLLHQFSGGDDVLVGADVAAVRNVALHAVEGSAGASGVGIGKDIYRETLAAIASFFRPLTRPWPR